MKTSLARLSVTFGNLPHPYKIRGITKYHLSPMESRAFAGNFSKGVPNMLRRISEEIFYVVPRKHSRIITVPVNRWREGGRARSGGTPGQHM